MSLRLAAIALGLVILAPCTSFAGEVLFTNLSDQTAYVAQARYMYGQHGNPSGWHIRGWWQVAPGATLRSSSGLYRVKVGGQVLSWKNRPVKHAWARPQEIKIFLNDGWDRTPGDRESRFEQLRRDGYSSAEFQQFESGKFNIVLGQPAYRIQSEKFSFKFSSRNSVQHPAKPFPVAGQPVSYTVDARSRWAKHAWRIGDRSVSVRAATVGNVVATDPFAGRKEGYYKGTVVVYYTAKIPGGTI